MTKLSGVKKYMLIGAVAGVLFYISISSFLYPFGAPTHCEFICFPYWSLPTLYVMGALSVLVRAVAPHLPINLWGALFGAFVFYAIIGSITGGIIVKIRKIK